MFCFVRGHGGWRAWRTTVSPTRWTPFPFRPLHAWLVWCWPACVWSVYGHVVAAAVVLLVHSCDSRLMVCLFGVGSFVLLRALARSDVVPVVVLLVSVLVGRARVGLRLGLCCLLGRGWCCAGAWPPSWWGVLRWCVAPPMVGRAVLVRAARPLWGVLCRCVAPPKVAAVLACGPPHGRPCCCAAWPPSWWGVLCRCVAPLMVGRAVLVPVRRGGCAWCGGAWLWLSSCVPPGGRRWVRVGGACGGVLAGAMRGLFCLCGVVFAAIRSACSGGCGRALGCGCGCVDRLAGVGSVLVRGPPHGWAYCVGACPPPPLWGVLCWCVAPPIMGRAVLVCGPPLGGACCVGLWSPSWWGVLCWCVPPSWWGVLCRCVPPPRGGACCVGLWPPSWWGVLRWCVVPLSVGRAVSVPARRGGGVWFGVWSSVGSVVVAVVLLAWPGLVLCCCVPPPLLGRAVFVRAPPLGEECCVGVFGFWFVVL